MTSPNEKIRNIFVSLFGSVDVVAQAHHEQNCAELYALWRVDRNVKSRRHSSPEWEVDSLPNYQLPIPRPNSTALRFKPALPRESRSDFCGANYQPSTQSTFPRTFSVQNILQRLICWDCIALDARLSTRRDGKAGGTGQGLPATDEHRREYDPCQDPILL